MPRTKIEDLSAVEEIDKAEQEAVEGGGLKKWKKKATKAATGKSAQSAGISALQGTATAGSATVGALDTAGNALNTAGNEIESAANSFEDIFHHSYQSDENSKMFTP